jgi:hypothetical protein
LPYPLAISGLGIIGDFSGGRRVADVRFDLKAPNHRKPRRCALTPLAIKYGLEPVVVQDTDHYRMMREFCADPAVFVDSLLEA